MTESCGFCWALDGICFASERPAMINLDSRGRLHAENTQSIQYSGTGWGLWHWHGLKIPDEKSWIITDKLRITKDAILAETNTELRRVMCESVGWPKAIELLGGKNVASDELHGQPRQLVDVRIGTGEKVRLIKLVNGTVEADGTRHEFIEGVPLTVKTPHAAEAWAYGIAPKHYREAVRT